MARKKADEPKLRFLKPNVDRHETKPVSARVDAKLLADFEQAVKLAADRGYSLTMTGVITQAIEDAVDEVERLCNTSAKQMSIEESDNK